MSASVPVPQWVHCSRADDAAPLIVTLQSVTHTWVHGSYVEPMLLDEMARPEEALYRTLPPVSYRYLVAGMTQRLEGR